MYARSSGIQPYVIAAQPFARYRALGPRHAALWGHNLALDPGILR